MKRWLAILLTFTLAAAINGAADLFEVILNPFGARDLSAVALADVGEDHKSYELFGGQ